MIDDGLRERRAAKADDEYGAYDFGDAVVAGQSGWMSTEPGRVMARTVFLGEDAPTTRVGFVVGFADEHSDEVTSVEARGGDGGTIGRRMAAAA